MQTLRLFYEDRLEAKSLRTSLSVLIGPEAEVADFVEPLSGRAMQGGHLKLDAHGHAFGVELLVPRPQSIEAMRGLADRWIRAETVQPKTVDALVDGTGQLGMELSPVAFHRLPSISHDLLISPTTSGMELSPVLHVEMARGQPLEDPPTALLPTCLGTLTNERTAVSKEDVIVCHATWQGGEWTELEATEFELLPLRPMPKYGCEMPFVALRVASAGLYAVHARTQRPCRPNTRVRALAFLPTKLSPLELQVIAC